MNSLLATAEAFRGSIQLYFPPFGQTGGSQYTTLFSGGWSPVAVTYWNLVMASIQLYITRTDVLLQNNVGN